MLGHHGKHEETLKTCTQNITWGGSQLVRRRVSDDIETWGLQLGFSTPPGHIEAYVVWRPYRENVSIPEPSYRMITHMQEALLTAVPLYRTTPKDHQTRNVEGNSMNEYLTRKCVTPVESENLAKCQRTPGARGWQTHDDDVSEIPVSEDVQRTLWVLCVTSLVELLQAALASPHCDAK
ncbi:hypothetical protein J6590_005910 [Homalodisca vitripennis]|nr:hypothetical protein J6590_005910 [Homalodisca vitripennis]